VAAAINCERPAAKKLCADWVSIRMAARTKLTVSQVGAELIRVIAPSRGQLAVDAYPSVYLLNRKHGALAKYPKDADKAADKVAAWAVDTAKGWVSHLFPASNLTKLDARCALPDHHTTHLRGHCFHHANVAAALRPPASAERPVARALAVLRVPCRR
jgi:hypothetical protein